MRERRPMLGALIGLTLCISIWKISIQEPPITTEIPYIAQPFVITAATTTSNDTLSNHLSLIQSQPVNLSELEKFDLTNLIDLNDFTFNINHKSCSEVQAQPLVLILVHSAPKNLNKRKLIRETWGRDDPRSRLLFLLGSVNSTDLQDQLDNENRLHGDMVQGNFIDAYQNMTYKHVMALKWFTYYCPEAKYILKTDDDVFINTPTIYDFLDSSGDRRKLIFCWEVPEARVKRTYRSKWRVSTKQYSGRYYPPYCPGFSIIYSPDIAFQLYKEAQRTPYFWIDDVHLTGTLAQKINTSITPVGGLFLSSELKNNIVSGKITTSNLTFFFTTPNLKENEIRKLWKAVETNVR